ncbi:cupin domain-containing protein [Rhizobium phaseoli]|jgi:quercetin dioxygenase-like cupin family protein|uniref:Cupin domain-containing protein n=1 Tax=Rhizobium phaseoli TaxID=396 RepID=A0A7K3U8A5_9HYPH|nr:cupin domain-containing protein [Rhizobium phaseoli]NEJ69078.1 cupin domain-containing protein [Rhizobium phaseoli]
MERISLIPAFKDARGEITDLLENENINAITRITFSKGAVRGNHYHKQTTQWNYLISGRIMLVSQVPGEPMVETVMNPGDFTVTKPHVRHALVGLDDAELLVFTSGPRGGKEYESDTFRLDVPLAAGT